MKSLNYIRTIVLAAAVSLTNGAGLMAQRTAAVSALEPYVYPSNALKSPSQFVYMPDGQSYLLLSDDHTAIVRYDVRSGKEIEKYVDLKNTRETTLDVIEGFRLSADASKVLVWRNTEPIYRRSFTAEYYVYEVRTRLLRPLSTQHEVQRSPIFSPDARMVAFVADNNIYVKKLDFNTEVAVTEDGKANSIINGVSDWTYEEEFAVTCSMAFSPDNSTLCFVRYDESQVPSYSLTLYEGTCSPERQYALYPGRYDYKYPVAGAANSRVSLHSYDIDTRKIKDIALPDAGIEYIPRIDYQPGGQVLVVPTLNRDQNRLEIYSVNPKSTVVKSIYVEQSQAWIDPQTYENLDLGEREMVVMSSRDGYTQLYAYSYTGSMLRQITDGECDVTAWYGSDAAGNSYYQLAAPTPLDRTIMRLDRKGVVTRVSSEKGWSSASFSPDRSLMLLSYSDSATPTSYTLCQATDGKKVRVVEDNADFLSKLPSRLPSKEFFTVNSDGYELNAYMIKPLDFSPSKKYPVIMTQYSGPGSQSVVNRWQLDFDYYYAQQGYIVVCVDPRGTGGRGRKFSDVVYKRLGYYETIDQCNAARHIASLPYVDASRIGIYGWSYGGYEALMCATDSQTPFAAAVAIAPVTDWRYYDTVYAERYMLTPAQNEEGYNASAPLLRAHRLGCPLLMMYGTADDNVHPANTLEFVSRLQSAGLLCDMFVFPNMNHSINGCNARRVVYAKMLDFFDRNLK